MYGLAVNLIMSVSGHPSINNEITDIGNIIQIICTQHLLAL